MKKLLSTLLLAVGISSASANTDIVLPFSAGGSTSTVMQTMVPELESLGFSSQAKFMNNCQTARAQLGSRPLLYVWSNDLDCATPGRADAKTFVALLNWMPLYLCGTKSSLADYAGGTPRIGVNIGEFYTQLGRAVGQKVNPNTRVINYANTGATKTALKTGEVDLSLTSNGPAMAAEGLVTCYAATTAQSTGGLNTVKNIVGDVPGAVFSVNIWVTADSMSPAEVDRARTAVQKVIKGSSYQELTTKKLRRELPDTGVDQQIQRVNQSLLN
jgi:hypothetical protein